MSVKAKYRNGVFTPVGEVEGLTPGRIYVVLSEQELCDLRETLQLQRVSEKRFDFWDTHDNFFPGLD